MVYILFYYCFSQFTSQLYQSSILVTEFLPLVFRVLYQYPPPETAKQKVSVVKTLKRHFSFLFLEAKYSYSTPKYRDCLELRSHGYSGSDIA